VLLNTSFNGRDEPIVCSVADAWHCFQATAIDVLVLERFVVAKARS
jgi:carbamoyltransferase